jgi:hypothetical protein
MKYLPLLLLFTFLSCTPQKEVFNSWIGHEKKELILSWGPPTRTTSDGNGGEVLIYSNQYSYNYQAYWYHKMMYVNGSNKIYHWRAERNAIPPTMVMIR